MQAITHDRIKLDLNIDLKELTNMAIEYGVNNHGYSKITAIIDPDKNVDELMQELKKEKISIKIDNKNIFSGKIKKIEIKKVAQVQYLELELITASHEMDVKKKFKSFQDKTESYKNIIDKTISNYGKSDLIDISTNNQKTEKFVLQYRETDWEFIKRMASRFNAPITIDFKSLEQKLWIGIPKGEEFSEDEENFSVIQDILAYKKDKENEKSGIQEEDYIEYKLETQRIMGIGDKVSIKGRKYIIIGFNHSMDSSSLRCLYNLKPESYKWLEYNNLNLVGATIEGKVLSIEKDTMKIHLQIDEQQDKSKAIDFKYSTLYTVEGQTGFYCMPEINDSVELYCPNEKEDQAFICNSLRKKENSKVSNPKIKYIETQKGKELKMGGGELKFTEEATKEGNILINLVQDKGIIIESKKPINLKGTGEISFKAAKINIKAEESIYLVKEKTSTLMDGIVHFRASEVKQEGTDKS